MWATGLGSRPPQVRGAGIVPGLRGRLLPPAAPPLWRLRYGMRQLAKRRRVLGLRGALRRGLLDAFRLPRERSKHTNATPHQAQAGDGAAPVQRQ